MRLMIAAAAALLTLPAASGFAQTATPAPAAPAPAAPAPAPAEPVPATPQASPVPDTTAPAATSTKHSSKRVSLQQHFDEANTTHDGQLTREQADAAKWSYVSRHFDSMDKSHKGYVTVSDIQAYSKSSRAARHRRSSSSSSSSGGGSSSAPTASGQAGAPVNPSSPSRSPAPAAPQ